LCCLIADAAVYSLLSNLSRSCQIAVEVSGLHGIWCSACVGVRFYPGVSTNTWHLAFTLLASLCYSEVLQLLHASCPANCVDALFLSELTQSSICSTCCAWHPVASCDLLSNLLHSVAPRFLIGTSCLVILALSPISPAGSVVDWRCLRSCHAWLWVLCCEACSGLRWSAAVAECVALLASYCGCWVTLMLCVLLIAGVVCGCVM
jgi:hypothetical protein